jgi:1-acyl-sn-glycerol-3-phosphate acyltransferase
MPPETNLLDAPPGAPTSPSPSQIVDPAPIRAGIDREAVLRALPVIDAVTRYHATEVRGFDRLPEGAFLIVGNHSGGITTTDLLGFWAEWTRRNGPERPIALLAHDFYFRVPGFGRLLRRLGVIPASRSATFDALEAGVPVAVLPGGEWEMFRPWRQRNVVDLAGHTGFVKTALRAGVPIVPVTSHGAHESTFVLTRGETLARVTGLNRARVKVLPLTLSIPFGIGPALPSLPLPSKVTVEIGEALDWSIWGPETADDPTMVGELYDEVVTSMQATMARLAAEVPRPLLSRWRTDPVTGGSA